MYEEEVALVADDYNVDQEQFSVYKQGNDIVIDFCADSARDIDHIIDDACFLILQDYPDLTCEGAAYECKGDE